MPSEDVPDETHLVLRERAAGADQSLHAYLRSRLIAEASQPTVEEIFTRAEGRSGGSVSFQDAIGHTRVERESH